MVHSDAIVDSFLRKRRLKEHRSFGSSGNKRRRSTSSNMRSLPLTVQQRPRGSSLPHENKEEAMLDPDIPRTVEVRIQPKRSGLSSDEDKDEGDNLLSPHHIKETNKRHFSTRRSSNHKEKQKDGEKKLHRSKGTASHSEEKQTSPETTTETAQKNAAKSLNTMFPPPDEAAEKSTSTPKKDCHESTQTTGNQSDKESSSKDGEEQSGKIRRGERKPTPKDAPKADSLSSKALPGSDRDGLGNDLETRKQEVETPNPVESAQQPSAKNNGPSSGDAAAMDSDADSVEKAFPSYSGSQGNVIDVPSRGMTEQKNASIQVDAEPNIAHGGVSLGTSSVASKETTLKVSDEALHRPEKNMQTVDQGGWACPTCTFQNSEKARRCDMCKNRRPVTVDVDIGKVLSQRSCNTTKASPQSGSKISKGDSNSVDTAGPPSNSPDRSTKSSKKRRTPSTAKKQKRSQSPAKNKPNQTPAQCENPKSSESQVIEKALAPDDQTNSDAQRGIVNGHEHSEVSCSATTTRVQHTTTGDPSHFANADALDITKIQPLLKPTGGESVVEANNAPCVITGRKPDTILETDDARTNAALQAENKSLRQKVDWLEKELARARSDRNRVPFRHSQVSRLVAERLLGEFTVQAVASLGRMKDSFLNSHFDDNLSNSGNANNYTSLELAVETRDRKVSTVDSMQGTPSPTGVGQDKTGKLECGSGIAPQVSPIEQIRNIAPSTNTAGITSKSTEKGSRARSTETRRLSSQEAVDSLVQEVYTSPFLKDDQTSYRMDGPSGSQSTGEANCQHASQHSPSVPPSPANSTQTLDPRAPSKSVTRLIPEKSATTSIGQKRGGSSRGESPASGAKSPVKEVECHGAQGKQFAPPSPDDSTQTMDMVALNQRHRSGDGGISVSNRPDGIAGKIVSDDDNKKLGRTSTVEASPRPQPHPVSRCSATVEVGEKKQSTRRQAADGYTTPVSKAMGPPPRKNPPLGNSTNKKTSATWASKKPRKSFFDHLDQTSGTTGGSNGSRPTPKAASGWVASNQTTKPCKNTGADSGSIWDDSQDSNPNYKYQEVVRCKSKRQGLPCHDCADCKAFYDCMRRNGHFFSQDIGLMEHGRHRAQFAPTETPADFWEVDFLDEKRGAEKLAGSGVRRNT